MNRILADYRPIVVDSIIGAHQKHGALPMNILRIDSSILGEASASRDITGQVVEALLRSNPDATVVRRDLAGLSSHFDAELLEARSTPVELRSPRARERVAQAEAVLDEFLAADVVVLGAPMYNFGIPSQLKTWIDLVAVAGKTFRYTEAGPEGLAGDKRVILAATAGGRHAGRASGVAHIDYLTFLLGFLGITDIELLVAEGLALGEKEREEAMAAALGELEAIAA
jgi:FMN-dependent NADH-azoreductase